jgi:uncharacterized membrane protein (DUF485 family)
MTDAAHPAQQPGTSAGDGDPAVYADIAGRDDFTELKRRYFNFAVPATVAFMIWYIAYVVANNWARDFMNMRVIGNINVALVWGLLQFVSTFLIAFLYSRHANKALDPLASKLREEFDQRTGR